MSTEAAAVAFEERPVSNGTTTNTNGSSIGQQARPKVTPRPPVRRSQPLIVDPHQALQEQLQDQRTLELRADAGQQYLENLALPNTGDLWIPGQRTISPALAKELGLQAAFEGDPFEELPLDEPQPKSAAVDGNIVASFVDGVTGQQKLDVLNSCLLAQLASNVKFDKEQDPVNWTRNYCTVLENIGWVVPSFSFSQLRAGTGRFTIDQAIMKLISGLLSPNEIETVKLTIDAIKALEAGDGRIRIFEHNSTENRAGNMQFDTVGVSSGGTLSMKLTAYLFQTNQNVTNVLWFSFSGTNTMLKVTKNTLVLNEQVYDRLRDPIVTKLGNRGLDYVRGLEI